MANRTCEYLDVIDYDKQPSKRIMKMQNKIKVILTIILLWICIGITIYVINDALRESQNQMLAYTREQVRLLTKESAQNLRKEIAYGKSLKEITQFIKNDSMTLENMWPLLSYDNYVLFAKDDDYTRQYLNTAMTLDAFQQQLLLDGQRLETHTFKLEDNIYTYGIIIDEKTICEQMQQSKTRTIILFATGFLGLSSLIVILWLLIENKRMVIKNNQLVESLADERLKRQQATERILINEPTNSHGFRKLSHYDRKFLEVMLKKSNKEALMPLNISYIKWELSNRYYTKKELQDLMDIAKSSLGQKGLFFEVGKGEMVILMYRMSRENASFLIRRLENELSPFLRDRGIKQRSSMKSVATGEDSYLTFLELETEVKERGKSKYAVQTI